MPDAKERRVRFPLPPMEGPSDLHAALGLIIAEVAEGRMTVGQAKGVAELLELARRAFETVDLAERISRLEEPH